MPDFDNLTDVKTLLSEAQEAEEDNRAEIREVTHFLQKPDGQWEPGIVQNMSGRPRYTFDKCNPIVDAISGERERDTLRLVASNAVSRVQILLGKYLATIIVTTAVLLAGSLVSLIIIRMLSAKILTSDSLAPLALFMLLSAFYVSLFINISLLVSSLAKYLPV